MPVIMSIKPDGFCLMHAYSQLSIEMLVGIVQQNTYDAASRHLKQAHAKWCLVLHGSPKVC